jgi:hypothetical protein
VFAKCFITYTTSQYFCASGRGEELKDPGVKLLGHKGCRLLTDTLTCCFGLMSFVGLPLVLFEDSQQFMFIDCNNHLNSNTINMAQLTHQNKHNQQQQTTTQ